MEQPQQRSAEWHAQRVGRVTGSIVGAILGVAPYLTRDECLRSMVRAYHNAPSEFTCNIATEWGTQNEAGAVWAYELETGNTVVPAYFETHEDWLGASPDGYIGEDGLLEVKCPFGIRKDLEPKLKSIANQPHYYGQIQVQLYVTGRKWCDFWQWTPHGQKLERVEYSQEWIDNNLPKLRQFHAEYLSEIDNPSHLEPIRKEISTQAARLLLDEYDQLSEAITNAEERRKEVMALLVGIADGKNAFVCGRKLTKVERAGSVKYADVVKKHLPDLDLTPYKGKSSEFWKLG